MASSTLLVKKTKAEILEEYQKLLEQYEELKMTSRIIHDPQSREVIQKARENTSEKITQSIADLKTTMTDHLNDLSDQLLQEVRRFDELEQAIELSRNSLELQYHIQIAAQTIENLVQEHETKKKQLEGEFENQRKELEMDMVKRKRDQKREQEEYAYTVQLQRRRWEEEYEETKSKREKELAEREAALKQQEVEVQRLQRRIDDLPEEIVKEVSMKEKEIREHLEFQWLQKFEVARKDWQAEKRVNDLTIENLRAEVKRQTAEIVSLKQEADRVAKKAQELAIKVIESQAVVEHASEKIFPSQQQI